MLKKKQKLGFEDEQKPKGPNGLNQNSAIRASWSKINTGGPAIRYNGSESPVFPEKALCKVQ